MSNNEISQHRYEKTADWKDIDIYDEQLRKDLKELYGNRDILILKEGNSISYDYLVSKKNEWRYGSDTIINTYIYHQNYNVISELSETEREKYKKQQEKAESTIGAHIIFPKNNSNLPRAWSINQARGMNQKICDRFDLTLECIKRYYDNDKDDYPLKYKFEEKENAAFFDLFKDKNGKNGFEGYVNFFYLNDLLVNNDYTKINYFLPFDNFERFPKPQDINEWKIFCEKQIEFINARNIRISSL